MFGWWIISSEYVYLGVVVRIVWFLGLKSWCGD